MEEKRGIKRSRSSVSGSSSSLSGASTLPPSPSQSMPPPVQLPEASLCRPPSQVREHGVPSEAILVVDLSFDEEEIIPDIMQDEEFTRRLFGELNCERPRPPGDDNIIILSDSDKEEEAREEITAGAEAALPSTVNSPAPFVSVANTDDAPDTVQDVSGDGGDKAGSP
jgi:hypothetical protein